MFEPLVIQALKDYTSSSDIQVQAQVLSILVQLIRLRVNYALLDSEQVQFKSCICAPLVSQQRLLSSDKFEREGGQG